MLFRMYCASCHGPDGKSGVPNPGSTGGTIPPLNPIDRILQHGAIPKGPMPEKGMLESGRTNSPTPQEIADLGAYLLEQNGVDRAQPAHPGIPPKAFFLLTPGALALAAAAIGGFRAHMRSRT